tara:strand:- start:453 stop:2225 length:1773 start_codon:yes stop_codon:yes gene_type:complete
MSFFQSEGKINIGQTDIRISAENGLDFSQDQTIGIYIPPSVKFFSGKDCFLQFDALISGDFSAADITPTRLTLDGEIGANSLFSQLRVYAGNRETLLEENTEYASYVSLKYGFEKDEVLQRKRALTEGAGQWVPNTRGTRGTTRSVCNDYIYSPYNKCINSGSGDAPDKTADADNTTEFIPAKITLPLHCGIFGENSKVYPNMLTNGVYLELVMANGRNLFRQFDGALRDRRAPLNPVIHGVDAGGSNWKAGGGDKTDTLYIDHANNQKLVQNCPFIPGEALAVAKEDGSDVDTDAMIVKEIETKDKYLVITLTAQAENKSGADIDDKFFLYSDALKGASAGSTFQPTCTLSNVELIVKQIDMSPEYERGMLSKVKESGGVVRFDYPSVGVQRHSTLSSEVQASVPLHLDYARAKGLICMPTDATIYPCHHQTAAKDTYMITKDKEKFIEDFELRSNRTGLEGCSNGLSEYSFFLNGKMVPSRAIKTSKTTNKNGGIDANFIVELEKSLISFGIEPKSFENYNRNFVVGRMLAMGENAVFDGRGRTARLDLKYEGTDADYNVPSVNTLWKIFVYHLRTLTIKANDIMVEM